MLAEYWCGHSRHICSSGMGTVFITEMRQDTLSINSVNNHHFPFALVWAVFLSHLGFLDSGVGASIRKK